ncbi:hypothetical protein [Streptomyces sp. 6N223]|uniref:hypothetical protein n=1 Tax=Streptomyces sp. 6N223 TaxID=3457412 RepID=UPI003FD40B23
MRDQFLHVVQRVECTFPPEVDPLKCVNTKAHLRVGDGNTIASRVHFHDDASRPGKVCVGYCGPFLTNTRT